MPARRTTMKVIIAAIACGLWFGSALAEAQDSAAQPLPSLVRDSSRPVPWPQARDGSTWVPVFIIGDGDDSLLANPFATDAPGSVLLGVAQVRGQTYSGQDTVAVSPSLRWQLSEDLRFGAAMTVTEFVPCRSLMQAPLAPVQSDACESFAARNAGSVGVSSSLSLGSASFSLGYSESPAIWVLPGAIGAAATGNPAAVSLPMSPVAGFGAEPAQTLSLGGELSLSTQSRLGVALAMSRLPRLENSPDIGRVQFSVAYGDFSADMATQMIRQGIETVSPWWAGMDLGVSWRTPWSGIISVGARNLFSTGDPPQLGNSPVAGPSEADAFSRTPYVRYEQDF